MEESDALLNLFFNYFLFKWISYREYILCQFRIAFFLQVDAVNKLRNQSSKFREKFPLWKKTVISRKSPTTQLRI